MSAPSAAILIAGIGNLLRGDDGFGCEVARRLVERGVRDGVRVIDFGIRGIDLTYALGEPWHAAIFVDAMARGRAPGSLCVLVPSLPPDDAPLPLDAHTMDPLRVLQAARQLGPVPPRLRVLGCEPAQLGGDDEPLMALSREVTAAVAPALMLVDELVDELLEDLAGGRQADA